MSNFFEVKPYFFFPSISKLSSVTITFMVLGTFCAMRPERGVSILCKQWNRFDVTDSNERLCRTWFMLFRFDFWQTMIHKIRKFRSARQDVEISTQEQFFSYFNPIQCCFMQGTQKIIHENAKDRVRCPIFTIQRFASLHQWDEHRVEFNNPTN